MSIIYIICIAFAILLIRAIANLIDAVDAVYIKLVQHIDSKLSEQDVLIHDEVLAVLGEIRQHSNVQCITKPEHNSQDETNKSEHYDRLLYDVAKWAIDVNGLSTSAVQRHFAIGFSRAGKIVDQLYSLGICGPSAGNSSPRKILITMDELDQQFMINSPESRGIVNSKA